MALNYLTEHEELFIYDEITDEDKCQIELPEFKNWLRTNGKKYEDLKKDELIDLAIKFDQDLFQELNDLFKPIKKNKSNANHKNTN